MEPVLPLGWQLAVGSTGNFSFIIAHYSFINLQISYILLYSWPQGLFRYHDECCMREAKCSMNNQVLFSAVFGESKEKR